MNQLERNELMSCSRQVKTAAHKSKRVGGSSHRVRVFRFAYFNFARSQLK